MKEWGGTAKEKNYTRVTINEKFLVNMGSSLRRIRKVSLWMRNNLNLVNSADTEHIKSVSLYSQTSKNKSRVCSYEKNFLLCIFKFESLIER